MVLKALPLPQVFTGQVPFPENKSMAVVMKRIINGERPQRPRQGETLGLSDELWEVIRSSLACELERRPSASTFVGSLEKATPDIAVLKELTKFDANSEGHIQKLRHMFELGDNTLLGMREKETLTVIEVFDQVSLPDFLHLSNFSDFIWFQVLNSSLNDPTFRSRCLHGLKKVSSRSGLLPKSYLLSHSSLAGHVASSATEKVSSTRQWSIGGGKAAAVKTISPGRIENFDTFKCVRLFPLQTVSYQRCFLFGPSETVHQCDLVETITTSKCS